MTSSSLVVLLLNQSMSSYSDGSANGYANGSANGSAKSLLSIIERLAKRTTGNMSNERLVKWIREYLHETRELADILQIFIYQR